MGVMVKQIKTLTTAEAVAAAGFPTRAAFHSAASRAIRAGIVLQAPEDTWPDKRTPLWDADRVTAWAASRPGRGNWKRS